jgi:two-component system chemotaxis response regulator CheY
MPPTILVVDDYAVVRRTIRDLLDSHSFDVCGEAENGQEAVEKVKALQPNLVLLDINMPKMNGIQAAFEIRQLVPATKILFLSVQECSAEALAAIRLLGAVGFVAKSEAGTELVRALKRLFPDETAVESGRMLVAPVCTLSLCGCFVKTNKTFQRGTKVVLRITNLGFHFSATGRIVDLTNDGIGIEFVEIGPSDRARLEDCLVELAGSVSGAAIT